MGLFSKKIQIKSPIKGKLIDITEVKDEAFSTKALGDGMAIIPEEGKVYSPVDGEVVTMAMNYMYIDEPLKVMNSDRVRFEFTESMKAVTFKPVPEADYFHIIMPMQME